jgi:hypothetical protein
MCDRDVNKCGLSTPVKIDSIYIILQLRHYNIMQVLICFVGYTITSNFKTIKLVFSTMCFPEMDCATGCTPLLNTKTLLDIVALMRHHTLIKSKYYLK